MNLDATMLPWALHVAVEISEYNGCVQGGVALPPATCYLPPFKMAQIS